MQPLWFLRPISPQFNHIFFILALILLQSLIAGKKKSSILFAGICIGLLFYVHYCYWTFIYAGMGVLCLIDRKLWRVILPVFAISLLISIPFFVRMHTLRTLYLQNWADYLHFLGIRYNHTPNFPLFHIIVSVCIIFALWGDQHLPYIASFLIGGFICLNQQVITGVVPLPLYWRTYTNKTFIMIALVYAVFKTFKEK